MTCPACHNPLPPGLNVRCPACGRQTGLAIAGRSARSIRRARVQGHSALPCSPYAPSALQAHAQARGYAIEFVERGPA